MGLQSAVEAGVACSAGVDGRTLHEPGSERAWRATPAEPWRDLCMRHWAAMGLMTFGVALGTGMASCGGDVAD